jgi:uncharacterized protein (TIGR02217 family)
MSYQVYPGINVIRGLTWKITRTPMWETLSTRMSSGKEFRLSYWTYPLWKWELEYNYLKDNPNDLVSGNVDTDLVILQGFFNQMAGQFQIFLFDDVNNGDQPGAGPWDSVTGQAIAAGDGVTTTFQLIRTSGGFPEAIQAPYTVPPPTVYLNGAVQSYGTNYSVDGFGNIIFASAPGSGVAITADFGYYWPVRFGSDELDFETQLYQLWQLKKITLQQVRL